MPQPMPLLSLRRVLAIVFLFGACVPILSAQDHFDILIAHGRLIDGSGNPWRRADVGIRGDRIVAIGGLAGSTAAIVIDAKDRFVAPGDRPQNGPNGLVGAGRLACA